MFELLVCVRLQLFLHGLFLIISNVLWKREGQIDPVETEILTGRTFPVAPPFSTSPFLQETMGFGGVPNFWHVGTGLE